MRADVRRGWYGRLVDAYSWLLSTLLVLTVAALIVPVSLQIFARYTPLVPFYIWTEEMARFVFIWMIMLGAMLGVREGTHFTVDVWPRLGARASAWLDIVAGVAILGMALVFVWWGGEFTRFALRRISELAELPLWWIHVAWPLTGVTWLVFMGERVVLDIKVLRQGADL